MQISKNINLQCQNWSKNVYYTETVNTLIVTDSESSDKTLARGEMTPNLVCTPVYVGPSQ